MKNILIGSFFLAASAMTCHSQINIPWTQYNQIPYLQNAGLTGIEEYTDIKAGYKKQWASFTGAPRTYFLGGNHSIHVGQRRPGPSPKTVKLGFSGYLAQNAYNSVNDLQIGLAHAVHIPVSQEYYLSMGISASYNRLKTETGDLVVRDQADPMYQSFINNDGLLNYLNADAGIMLYSAKLYVGYSAQRLVRSRFNSDIPGNEKSNLRHVALLGYNHAVNKQWDIQPALLFRHESSLKDLYSISLKARYNGAVWGGAMFSPDEAISLMAGFRINSYLAFNYSYDISIGDTRSVSNGNHEIILGIMPFNKKAHKALLW